MLLNGKEMEVNIARNQGYEACLSLKCLTHAITLHKKEKRKHTFNGRVWTLHVGFIVRLFA